MADGVGGMAVDGGSRPLTLSSLAVLAFHGGGAGAGVPGAGDGGDILLDSTATAPGDILLDSTATAPNTVTTARMAMEIPATVMGMATDLATAMQANTAPPLDRGYPNYNSDSLVPVIIAGQSMEPSGPRRSKQFAPIWRTTVTQAHPLPPINPTATDLAKQLLEPIRAPVAMPYQMKNLLNGKT